MFHCRYVQPTVHVRLYKPIISQLSISLARFFAASIESMGIPSWMFGVIMAKSLEKLRPDMIDMAVVKSRLEVGGPISEAA